MGAPCSQPIVNGMNQIRSEHRALSLTLLLGMFGLGMLAGQSAAPPAAESAPLQGTETVLPTVALTGTLPPLPTGGPTQPPARPPARRTRPCR